MHALASFLLASSVFASLANDEPASCVENRPPDSFTPRLEAPAGAFVGAPLECVVGAFDRDGDPLRYAFEWWFLDLEDGSFSRIRGEDGQTLFPRRSLRNGEIFCAAVAFDGRGGATRSFRGGGAVLGNRPPRSASLGCPGRILVEFMAGPADVAAAADCTVEAFDDPDGDSPRLVRRVVCPDASLARLGSDLWQRVDGRGRDAPCFVEVGVADEFGLEAPGLGLRIPLVNRHSTPFGRWMDD